MKRKTDREATLTKKSKKSNALLWLYEPLEKDPRFVRQKLFSTEAAYLEGRLYFAAVDREEPWNGLMICTWREHHASLQAEFPQLTPHPILGKWLYLSQSHADFESVAPELIVLAKERDPRLGVEPSKRKRRDGTAAKKRKG